MEELRAVICDDEPLVQDIVSSALVTCFKKYGYVLELDRYTDPVKFAKRLGRGAGKCYDIAFLDIDMPGLDGIELGKKLNEVSEKTSIIFISNREERVFDSFAAHPFGFVRKSSFLKDVESVVKIYISAHKKEPSGHLVEVKTKEGYLKLNTDEILYIESIRDYQYIHLKKEKEPLKVHWRMNQLEEGLKNFGFLRIHQGYLVNYRYIRKFGADTVELQNGSALPVSRRKRKEILQEYMRFSRKDDSIIKLSPGNM